MSSPVRRSVSLRRHTTASGRYLKSFSTLSLKHLPLKPKINLHNYWQSIGWHVPSIDEWSTLEDYLIAAGYNYNGYTTGKNVAKALGSSTGWRPSTDRGVVGNTDYPAKINASGFSGYPSSHRFSADGHFDHFGGRTSWWSTSEYSDTTVWIRYLITNYSHVFLYHSPKKNGNSVT